jgi:colanic acid/amylovoran biosynthesis glycosyltransferase
MYRRTLTTNGITSFIYAGLSLILFLQTPQIVGMKILFVLEEFPKFIQPFVLNQITGLIDQGHNDIWILADRPRYADTLHPDVLKYNLLEKTSYKTLPNDKKIFDIILCNFGPSGCWGQQLRNNGVQGKLVTIFHGADLTQLTLSKKMGSHSLKLGNFSFPCHTPTMYQTLFQKGDLFLAISDYFKNKMISFGCKPEKIVLHHCGVDCSTFTYKQHSLSPRDTIRIVSTGRLVEKKGLAYGIKAVASLLKKYKNIEYFIIGDGFLKKDLAALITRLNVGKNIKMLGWQNQEEVVKILYNAHIFLLPSVTAKSQRYLGDEEGIPVSIMEAMAMGLPIISTFHSGIPELAKDGKSGFLVPERNVKELAEKLEHLITHPNLLISMGYAGRKQIEKKFNIDQQNQKLVHILEQLINPSL